MNTKLTSPNPSKGGEPAESTDFVENIENEKQLPGYITANLQSYRFIKDGRENLKNNPTEAEKLIWEYLRNKKTGHKIRRQHVIDNFIADFVCLPKKAVIEIDGEIHIQQKEYDAFRTNTLNEKGYKVIRFTNAEVFANPALVATKIKEILDSRKTLESNN
jgi:very-short-patch-repair endonuclease